MKPALKLVLVVMLAAAFLAMSGCSLYRRFVTDQIRDGGGGMTNPDAERDGAELVEFSWQQNHRNSSRCFTLDFYLEDEMPVVSGRFRSRNGDEILQTDKDAFSKEIPWMLTWVQWFELQHTLAELELPEYCKADSDILNETDSRITIVWQDDGEEKTVTLDGSNAETLEEQVLNLAQEAYDASKAET